LLLLLLLMRSDMENIDEAMENFVAADADGVLTPDPTPPAQQLGWTQARQYSHRLATMNKFIFFVFVFVYFLKTFHFEDHILVFSDIFSSVAFLFQSFLDVQTIEKNVFSCFSTSKQKFFV
jgi:hypothetical protein